MALIGAEDNILCTHIVVGIVYRNIHCINHQLNNSRRLVQIRLAFFSELIK
jgi:hypothetical protein